MAVKPAQTGFDHAAAVERLPSHNDQERHPAAELRTPENGKHSLNKHSARVMPEQNPELLHWRANVLLDEMMLGAIDIAANDSIPARALSQRQNAQNAQNTERYASARYSSRDSGATGWAASGNEVALSHNNDYSTKASARHDTDNVQPSDTERQLDSFSRSDSFSRDDATGPVVDAYPVDRGAPGTRQSATEQYGGGAARAEQDAVSHQRPSSVNHSPLNEQFRQSRTSGAELSNGGVSRERITEPTSPARPGQQPGNGTEQWLFAAEQRYQQLAARRQASQGSATTAPGYDYDGWSMAPEHTSQQEYHVPAAPYSRENNHDRIPSYGTASVPVLPTTPPPVAVNGRVATKNGRKSLRSNLLPRMSALDSRAVQQEMLLLQSGIESVLPAGHESRTRTQHLLQKAHAILQDDPTHSAEVEYYLQQVRTIVQRAQETVQWSSLYQKRLRSYLLAWLTLSAIIILSRYLYAAPLSTWLARVSGQSSEGLWIYNVLTMTNAFFFGALGGAVGALYNMLQHARLERGFFDRKYGLRGLILPLIGALLGLSLCVVCGILYSILGADPASNLWFGLVPALLALALSASQEYVYGTRI